MLILYKYHPQSSVVKDKECHIYTTPQSGSIGLHCRGSAFVFHCDSISSYILLGLDGTKPLTRFLLSCVSWLTHRLWGESMGSRLEKNMLQGKHLLRLQSEFCTNTVSDFFLGRQEMYCRDCGNFCFCHPVTRCLSVTDRLSVRLKSCISCTNLD